MACGLKYNLLPKQSTARAFFSHGGPLKQSQIFRLFLADSPAGEYENVENSDQSSWPDASIHKQVYHAESSYLLITREQQAKRLPKYIDKDFHHD